MIKLVHLMLLLVLTGFPVTATAAQRCESESEIPASTPTAQFVDHGDGSVTDTATELMWAKCSEGLSGSNCENGVATTHTWQDALDLANTSTLAGHSDWRLPNVNELFSIVEVQCFDPSINQLVFPNTPSLAFWSSSPSAEYSENSWRVVFNTGAAIDDWDNSNRVYSFHVRLVRGGE